jgi:hypothetical protein
MPLTCMACEGRPGREDRSLLTASHDFGIIGLVSNR